MASATAARLQASGFSHRPLDVTHLVAKSDAEQTCRRGSDPLPGMCVPRAAHTPNDTCHRIQTVFTKPLPPKQHDALCLQARGYLDVNGRLSAPRGMCPPDQCFAELGTQLIAELFDVAKANSAAYLGLRSVNFVASSPPPANEPVTLFQSSLLPPMLPREFADMIVRNTRCDPNLITLGAVLVLRYCEKQRLPPTLHMLHRMIAASIQVATKTHKDRFLRNDLAARLCGLSPQEMNRLEVELLHGCEWQVLVLADELVNATALVERVRSATLDHLRHADDETPSEAEGSGYSINELPSPTQTPERRLLHQQQDSDGGRSENDETSNDDEA